MYGTYLLDTTMTLSPCERMIAKSTVLDATVSLSGMPIVKMNSAMV